jgi:proteasome lid subunit RPN8/RPN11
MTLHIRQDLLEGIFAHAVRTYPEECCGFLIGREEKDRIVSETVPAKNSSQDSRKTRYAIEPMEIMKCEREARAKSLSILGYYHSHPDHPAVPSEFDRKNAWPSYSYLIVSVMLGSVAGVRSWRLSEDAATFIIEPVEKDA